MSNKLLAPRPLMTLTDIVKTYHLEGVSSTVLKEVSLTVYEGDMLAIVGASGSGKSTLMNIMGLLDKADKGTYLLQDRNVAALTDDDSAFCAIRILVLFFSNLIYYLVLLPCRMWLYL